MEINIEGEARKDEPLSFHTSIRTGGNADYFFIPLHDQDLSKVMSAAQESRLPHLTIGEGTNVLFSDEGFRGCVVKLGKEFESLRISGEKVYAGAALKLQNLVHESVANSLSGLERLYGIPGTVGGAASTNAGAYGTWFGDLVESVAGMGENGNRISVRRNEIEFGYRRVLYPEEIVVTHVELKLARGSPERSFSIMEECLEKRRASQPLGELTAGCVFKNPSPDLSAGKVIEECGLKGKKVGDAVISPRHANFIVNNGKATTDQILSLMELVVDEVRRKKGIELHPELKVLA
jgi:UDP-N-acetylmuramate dehydrogenase